MATETEFKYSLEGAAAADMIAGSEYVTQYLKDDWTVRKTHDVYYDTADWDLAERDAMLRVRAWVSLSVATLKYGTYDLSGTPGLYRGHHFTTVFHGIEPVIRELIDKGADSSFEDLSGALLSPVFEYKCTRRYATLYLPEMTRAEISFDHGTLTVGDKSETFTELTLELLFGPFSELDAYCERLITEHNLEPRLQTKQKIALRLLRSR